MKNSQIERNENARNAIKDILFMYKTLIDYSGLFDDFGCEDGTFNPYLFVNCSQQEYDIDEEEEKLLNEGSAIKLICKVYQAWGQHGYPESSSTTVDKIKDLLENGCVDHLPELKCILVESIENIQLAEKKFDGIYRKYVVGYFESLIR